MRYSILDLSPVPEGSNARQAIVNSIDLAQRAEAAGYYRYWMAEHHNMPGIASAATSVLIGHVADHTKTLQNSSGRWRPSMETASILGWVVRRGGINLSIMRCAVVCKAAIGFLTMWPN